METYYNSSGGVNGISTPHPKCIVYLGGGHAFIDDFALDDTPEEISAAWMHILTIGFHRNARADRIGDALYVVTHRRGPFVGGCA